MVRALPKPVLGVLALAAALAVFLIVGGSGDSEAPAAVTTTVAEATTTTTAATTTTTTPANTWIEGGRPVLKSSVPTGATKYGKAWVAKAGTVLTAPETVWGDGAKVSAYRWDRCDPGQRNCEPIDGATKSTYRVPQLPARTELRAVLTIPTKRLTVVSAAVVIP